MKKDVISIMDLQDDLESLVKTACEMKSDISSHDELFRGKTIALLFEKPSTRTRLSFEVGVHQLGGKTLYITPNTLQLGRGESIHDTAKVMSRYLSALVYRAYNHSVMVDFAAHATIPVVNALDDIEHPCQAAADMMTIYEKAGRLKGVNLFYIGDGNNVCNSLLLASAIVGVNMTVCTPQDHGPNQEIVEMAREVATKTGSKITLITNPQNGIKDADFIYTDTWISMGDEAEKSKRLETFAPYQVNRELVSKAPINVKIMHCLPAHRGVEITDDIMDGPGSIVFDQAENRLHMQKAILAHLL